MQTSIDIDNAPRHDNASFDDVNNIHPNTTYFQRNFCLIIHIVNYRPLFNVNATLNNNGSPVEYDGKQTFLI